MRRLFVMVYVVALFAGCYRQPIPTRRDGLDARAILMPDQFQREVATAIAGGITSGRFFNRTNEVLLKQKVFVIPMENNAGTTLTYKIVDVDARRVRFIFTDRHGQLVETYDGVLDESRFWEPISALAHSYQIRRTFPSLERIVVNWKCNGIGKLKEEVKEK